jgi:flavin-dependent dehydrogenase
LLSKLWYGKQRKWPEPKALQVYCVVDIIVMKNVRILGAGPSGLTAAINLAKRGYEVDVYEEKEDVGMRFQGDIQGLENWSEKEDILEQLREMNIDIDFDCDPFFKMALTNCSKIKEVSSKRPLFYLVKRGSFSGTLDHSLKLQALRTGVNIHFHRTLPPSEANIVATGPIPRRVVGIVRGIVFKTNHEDAAVVAFSEMLAFRGYSYLLVTKRYGCIGAVVRRDEMSRAKDYFEKTKEYFVKHFNLDIRQPKRVGGIGSLSLENVHKGTTIRVGEAAGFQDFLWGFGMRYAIGSGYLAAQSIIDNLDYEKTAKKRFNHKLKAGVVNRYLMENVLSKDGYSIFVGLAELVRRGLYFMHTYNVAQRIVYPLAVFNLEKTYSELKS